MTRRFDPAPWRERIWIVGPVAAFFLINLAYFVGGRAVDASRAAALHRSRQEAEGHVAQARRELDSARKDAKHVEEVRSAAQEFYGQRIGTVDATMAATVAEIHRVCERNGLLPRSISYSLQKVGKAPLAEMNVGFSVAGDYGTLRRLIHGFENDPHWMVIRQITLARRTGAEGAAGGSIQMSLTTYFYSPRENEPAYLSASTREGAR